MKLKGDPTTTRALNRRLILNLLRQEGPRSRAELATLSGLSPAAVTFVVADLVEEGIVKEGEAISGMTGRRPIPVQIDYDHGIAIGFKLMLGAVECVATDLATNPIAAMRLGLEDHTPDAIADVLAKAVPRLVALAQRPQAKLAGIGISMPGVISNDQTSCVRSNRFDWNDVPLARMLAARVSAPVWLEDDTNAYAIAQQLFGLGRQHRNMAVLAVGVGIACAQIIEGKLYRGANGAAGKMGHTLFEPNGRPCECGKRGCLMAYHSEAAVVQRWREATGGATRGQRSCAARLQRQIPSSSASSRRQAARSERHSPISPTSPIRRSSLPAERLSPWAITSCARFGMHSPRGLSDHRLPCCWTGRTTPGRAAPRLS